MNSEERQIPRSSPGSATNFRGTLTLERKVAMVTGAGRGIGRAIAIELAKEGAATALIARSEAELKAVAADVESLGRKAIVLQLDVRDSEAVDHAVATTLAAFDQVDFLINNAGVFHKAPIVPIPNQKHEPPAFPKLITSRISDDEWRNVFAVNVDSAFYACRALAPHFLAHRSGVVINILSNSASQAHPFCSAYNASKAALSMLTRVLAREWSAYGVRVNGVAPGQFHTAMTTFSWSDDGERKKRLATIPMHREGDVSDIGRAVCFLCGPAATYITGQILHVDGGLTA